MIDDILKSIKASLYDRTSSPLFGTFLVSWCAWNFKLFMVILSSADIDRKLVLLDQMFFNKPWYSMAGDFLLPLTIALAWIFLYPYPAEKVYEYAKKRQNELTRIRQRIEDKEPLPQEEARKLRRRHLELENQHELDIKAKNEELNKQKEQLKFSHDQLDEIRGKNFILEKELTTIKNLLSETQSNRNIENEELKKELHKERTEHSVAREALSNRINELAYDKSALTTKNQQLQEEVARLTKKQDASATEDDIITKIDKAIDKSFDDTNLSSEQQQVLIYIGEHKWSMISDIKSNFNLSTNKAQYYIDVFIGLDFIARSKGTDQRIRFEVTAKGRAYLAKNKLI